MLVRRRKRRIEIEQKTVKVEINSVSAPLPSSQTDHSGTEVRRAADMSPVPEFSPTQSLPAAGQSSISSTSFEEQKENL